MPTYPAVELSHGSMDGRRGTWSAVPVPLAAAALQALLLASGDPAGAPPGPDPVATQPAAAASVAESSTAIAHPAPLAGCIAVPAKRDAAWKYDCSGAGAGVHDDVRVLDPGAYLDDREGAFRRRGGATFSRERAQIAGRDAMVLIAYSARGRQTKVAVFPREEGTRVVSCVGRPEACARVVAALAAAPWRAGPVAGARRPGEGDPQLGEAGPPLPAGCSAMPTFEPGAMGMITCPGGSSAMWLRVFDDAALSSLRDNLVANILSSEAWPGEPEDVACRIGGVEGSCKRLTAGSGSDRLLAMWGATTVEGVSWFAQCVADGDEPLPAPCSSVFTLR